MAAPPETPEDPRDLTLRVLPVKSWYFAFVDNTAMRFDSRAVATTFGVIWLVFTILATAVLATDGGIADLAGGYSPVQR